MKQKIAFRVDANHSIGFGHLKRCLVLAKELKKKADVLFIMKKNPQANNMVKQEKFKLIVTKGSLKNIITKEKINKIIIDLKEKTNKKYVSNIQKAGVKVILLDNLGEGRKNADIVIYPVAHIQSELLRDIKGQVFHGWNYTIINPAFFGKRNKSKKIKKILVSMGGSDVNNSTQNIISFLSKTEMKFECTVIIGPGFKNKSIKTTDKRFKIQKDVNNLSKHMLRADIGIILFGVSVYEAAAARLPSLIYADAHNLESLNRFSKFKTCINMGQSSQINQRLIKTLKKIFNNKRQRENMQKQAKKYAQKKSLKKTAKIILKEDAIINIASGKESIPFLKEAHKLGLKVISTDLNPKAPGLKFADEKIIESSYDTSAIIKKLEKIKDKYNFKGIITRSSPGPAPVTTSKIASHYKLKYIDIKNAKMFVNKGKFIKYLREKNISVPNGKLCSNIKQAKLFMQKLKPLIIKPAMPTQSKTSIRIINNEKDLEEAFFNAQKKSLDKKVQIEEFLAGSEHISIDIVSDKKIKNIIIIDEETTGPPYFQNISYSAPTTANKKQNQAIKKIVAELVKKCDIKFGLIYTAVIIEKENPKIIECHIDLGGDNVFDKLIPEATGINIINQLIRFYIGQQIVIKTSKIKKAVLKKKQKKILFLGCNHDQVEFLKEIKKLGYYIVGTDLNKNAPGVPLLDRYYPISYENYNDLIKIGKKEGFSKEDKVFTAGSQFAYLGASEFAKYFGIEFMSPEAIKICLDKKKIYKTFKKIGVNTPNTKFITNSSILIKNIEKNKYYFLKSDFSKNPNYVYQIKRGKLPAINWKKDRYFRHFYVLQEKIMGEHYRINYYNNTFFYFYKKSDYISRPVNGLKEKTLQIRIEKKIMQLIKYLGIEKYFVKFDLIISGKKYFVIDIGLDPPLRFSLLINYLGYNFARLYVLHYLADGNYPKKDKLIKKVSIKGRKVRKIK